MYIILVLYQHEFIIGHNAGSFETAAITLVDDYTWDIKPTFVTALVISVLFKVQKQGLLHYDILCRHAYTYMTTYMPTCLPTCRDFLGIVIFNVI